MQGHNALFVADCLGYMNHAIVDNVGWFRNMANNNQVTALSVPKAGNFDLTVTSINPRRVQFRVAPAAGLIGDAPIPAYWCPFNAGGGLPGWVDLPVRNPAHTFMFTPAMQGCALVVTNSPTPGHIRVSPSASRTQSQRRPGGVGRDPCGRPADRLDPRI